MDFIAEVAPNASFSLTKSERPTEDFVHISSGLMGQVDKNWVENQRRGFHKYEVNSQGNVDLAYVIWWNFGDPGHYTPIPHDEWQELLADQNTLDEVDRVLLNARSSAMAFFPWTMQSRGISIVNEDGFGLEKSGHLGIRASYPNEVKPLIEAVRNKDLEGIKEREIHLAASLVHEYVHKERDDGIAFGNSIDFEIVTHIGQFLYDPHNNVRFIRQIERRIENLKRDGVEGNTRVYDVGVYTALVLLADELQKLNPSFKELIDKDSDPNKFESILKMSDYIDAETRDQLASGMFTRAIGNTPEELKGEFSRIRESWQANANI